MDDERLLCARERHLRKYGGAQYSKPLPSPRTLGGTLIKGGALLEDAVKEGRVTSEEVELQLAIKLSQEEEERRRQELQQNEINSFRDVQVAKGLQDSDQSHPNQFDSSDDWSNMYRSALLSKDFPSLPPVRTAHRKGSRLLPSLPSGWTAHWSEEYQEYYYVQTSTGIQTWVHPTPRATPFSSETIANSEHVSPQMTDEQLPNIVRSKNPFLGSQNRQSSVSSDLLPQTGTHRTENCSELIAGSHKERPNLETRRGLSSSSSLAAPEKHSSPPALESPASSSNSNPGKTLGSYFTDSQVSYSDADCFHIAHLLKESGRHAWSHSPRIYIVLRRIGQLQDLDTFIDQGINDVWLPLGSNLLPRSLSVSLRDQFLETQKMVLTKAVDMENSSLARHAHFGKNEVFPFTEREKLGEGGYGYVDKVVSSLSGREFARKRFRRGRGQFSNSQLKSFKNELEILKRIRHSHCVELIASYTDSKYFGIILAPVAEYNLAAFYDFLKSEPSRLRSFPTFFGCLAGALSYLHDSKIRHRDIKPENILVKGGKVFLTDFGISLDWESLTRSTTTQDTAKSLVYCAPEVARYEKRNSSSDIWSLGCVFLEMWSVFLLRSVHEMRQFFKSRTESHRFYENLPSISDWLTELASSEIAKDVPRDILAVMETWISGMLQEEPEKRQTARTLFNRIAQFKIRAGDIKVNATNPLCGECCIHDDESSDSGSDNDPLAD
ncbi:kinase-like protein [Lophium mytilinum]|uniref:Kinase-like protein n=1 Tax=Lophium mytilinum TaxID=390894 RepID=A0A6A6QHR0_9PEZI|nr:kinase-like protein [Lophium mytilinum]